MIDKNGIDKTGRNIGSWDEWAIWVVKTLEATEREVGNLHDDMIRVKTKAAVMGGLAGLAVGLVTAIISALIIKL